MSTERERPIPSPKADADLPLQRRSLIQSAGLALGGAIVTGGRAVAAPQTPAAGSPDDATEEMAREVNNALEGAYGRHTGYRRNHTKGVGASGRFIGTPEAARRSRSALFSGAPIEVVARFSVAGGDPNAEDSERSTRGLGLEFRLPGGALHHITMLHTPMFFGAMPQTFLDKFRALAREAATGKPDAARFKAFLASHPDHASQAHFLAVNNPPPSYANCAFYGIHTFRFLDRHNKETLVRFRFVPRDGEQTLSDEELAGASGDFLIPRLFRRIQRGPIEWEMRIAIGEPGDSVVDPTILWPSNRREIVGGRLIIDRVVPDAQAGSFTINFDPLMMADGIAATDDPILLFRSPSYAVSHERRLREGRPAPGTA